MFKRLKSPLNAQIEVTSACNHSCLHCYNNWKEGHNRISPSIDDKKHSLLTDDDICSIVKKLGDAEVFDITLTGGEPLLNLTACLKCLEISRSYGMLVGMNSNLTLLTKESASLLKKAGINCILTSLLGPTAEIHDAITQRSKSFDLLIDGIRTAQDAGIDVQLNMIVSKLNMGHVKDTAKLATELGISLFSAMKANKPGNCKDFTSLELGSDQLVQVLNDLCWIKSNLGINVCTSEPIPICGLYGVDMPELFMSHKCNAGVSTVTVSYDGSVRPCAFWDVSYGNLLEESLDEIWDRMNSWREGLQIPTHCKSCKLFPLCGSGCRMEAKSRTGNMDSLDPYSLVEHVPEMMSFGQNTVHASVKERTEHDKFITSDFRLRKESVGGAIAFCGNYRLILNDIGFEVMSQLKPQKEYDASIYDIDWKGLDPKKFLSILLEENIIRLGS